MLGAPGKKPLGDYFEENGGPRHFMAMMQDHSTKASTRQYFHVTFSFPKGHATAFNNLDDLSYYITHIKLPSIQLDGTNEVVIKNAKGTYAIPGDGVTIPDSNKLVIGMLETEIPIIETFIIPWMEGVSFPVYDGGVPFSRANLIVSVLSQLNPDPKNPDSVLYKYVFEGVYPSFITLPELKQEDNKTTTRDVTFTFNSMHTEFPTRVVSQKTQYDRFMARRKPKKSPKSPVPSDYEMKKEQEKIENYLDQQKIMDKMSHMKIDMKKVKKLGPEKPVKGLEIY